MYISFTCDDNTPMSNVAESLQDSFTEITLSEIKQLKNDSQPCPSNMVSSISHKVYMTERALHNLRFERETSTTPNYSAETPIVSPLERNISNKTMDEACNNKDTIHSFIAVPEDHIPFQTYAFFCDKESRKKTNKLFRLRHERSHETTLDDTINEYAAELTLPDL